MKLRKLAKILGGILVLLILVLVTVPFFISSDFLKAQLIAQVKKTTGRTLEIKEAPPHSGFSPISPSAADVTLGNPAGFNSAYFVHIDKLETGAALSPLLSKQLHVTGITLDGATINLEQTANGAKNWEFAADKTKEAAAESADKSAKSSSPMTNFALGDVHIKNSAFTYNAAGAKSVAASDISLTLSGTDGASPLTFDGSARYQGEAVKTHIWIEQIKPFLAGKATKLTASIDLPGGVVQYEGTGSMGDDINADGKLETTISSLPSLMTWATGVPPAGALPKTVELHTNFALRGSKSIFLTEMTAEADETKLDGKLAINLADAVPAIRGTMHVGTLDLNQFKNAESSNASAAAAKSAPSNGWSDERIDLSGLRAVNANLDLKIDAIRSGNLEIGESAAQVGLTNGLLKLFIVKAALYEGSIKGSVDVNGSGPSANIATNIALEGVQIEPLMTALSGKSRLKGKANLTFALRGNGVSERAIVSTLEGNGSLKVADGAVKGVNIAQFLRDAKKGFLFGSNSSESTDFTELTATFTVQQGILTNKDLAMKSPALRLSGSGTVNLPSRALNYKLMPTIAATSKGQGGKDNVGGLTIPLLISGPWSNPQVVPDVAGLVQENLKDPTALKQNLKDIKSQIKNINSPKDIGRALFGGSKPATNTAQ